MVTDDHPKFHPSRDFLLPCHQQPNKKKIYKTQFNYKNSQRKHNITLSTAHKSKSVKFGTIGRSLSVSNKFNNWSALWFSLPRLVIRGWIYYFKWINTLYQNTRSTCQGVPAILLSSLSIKERPRLTFNSLENFLYLCFFL